MLPILINMGWAASGVDTLIVYPRGACYRTSDKPPCYRASDTPPCYRIEDEPPCYRIVNHDN